MIEKIAYNLGRNDEEPNTALAVQLCELKDTEDIREIVSGLKNKKAQIAFIKSKEIFENIDTVIEAYEKGSVITRDNSITVFAKLAKADKQYEKIMLKKIIEHLKACRSKEVGQHAERAFICINKENFKEFVDVLLERKENLTDAQKKRVDKLIKKIENGKFCY